MCHALSTQGHTVALVVPGAKPLRAWAEAKGLARPDTPFADLCALPAAQAEVLRSVQEAARGRVAPFAVPAAVGLVADPWTPENDLLTAAMKLRRPQIVKAHEAQLARIYA